MTPLVATYRLQVRGGLDLDRAAELLDHLERLGVSHAYLAPILQATEGSTHGYDVVDPTKVDDALGGDAAFARFVDRAHALGLGVVLDIVPNHMAAHPDDNPWWRDVLRHGRASAHAGHFDIVWDPPDRKLRNQVLVPVLGDHYGRVLERGELVLERAGTSLAVRYFERTFPLEPRSVAGLLHRAAAAADSSDLELLARMLDELPSPAERGSPPADAYRGRQADVALADRVLARALTDPAEHGVVAAIDAAIAEVNADRAELHRVLDQQNYRLARWQTGADEIDYRRFFDITGLVGVRVERHDVFVDTHVRIAEWIAAGMIDGLRVDHPDGLADPAKYAADLRDLAGDRWVVVEKIIEADEALPEWPVDGTTGYEFAAAVNRLFVDPDGYEQIAGATTALAGVDPDFAVMVRDAKLEVLDHDLAAELRRLTDRLVAVCEDQPRYRDFTRRELQAALATTLSCLPVYRTYVTNTGVASAQDRALVDTMLAGAATARSDLDPDLLALIGGALLGDEPFTGPLAGLFRQRFQQLSGAVMAKGKEDTSLYRYPVLLAANEVGADPSHAAASVDAFHAFLADLAATRPTGMLTLATHDTKRSDDVRARLDVLSEMPDRYAGALEAFVERHTDAFGAVDPDPLFLAVCFQTLVGAHPLSRARLDQYAEKASREAGVRTSWLDVDATYEAAMHAVVERATTEPWSQEHVGALVDEILVDGRVNALAQRLLLLTAPGVPDLYQGSELWDLSLVDPDNRRPVDFSRSAALLERGGWAERSVPFPSMATLADPDDPGLMKLALTVRALGVRRVHPAAFGAGGSYHALPAGGDAADHVVAFARGDDVVVAVPRLGRRRRERFGGWAATTLCLPEGDWHDALSPGRTFTGTIEIADLFATVPVALLHREGPAW